MVEQLGSEKLGSQPLDRFRDVGGGGDCDSPDWLLKDGRLRARGRGGVGTRGLVLCTVKVVVWS